MIPRRHNPKEPEFKARIYGDKKRNKRITYSWNKYLRVNSFTAIIREIGTPNFS